MNNGISVKFYLSKRTEVYLTEHRVYITKPPTLIVIKFKENSVALVIERTIPTERPPLVGEVSANFCG
jgi:hypothetical protein